MVRTVVILLIASLCANALSEDDCILKALQMFKGINSSTTAVVEEPPTTPSTVRSDDRLPDGVRRFDQSPTTSSTVRNDDRLPDGVRRFEHSTTTPLTVRSDDTLPDDLGRFEQLYLNLKLYYGQKLEKLELELENALRTKSNSTQSCVNIDKLETFCTCNVPDRPINNDSSYSKANIYLDKVQKIQDQLSAMTERNQKIEEKLSAITETNGRSFGNSDAEPQEGLVDWKKLPGTAIEISANGKELWVINSGQQIYRWNGSNWELKPGDAVRVGSSPDGWTWIVNKKDAIFRWNVDGNNWESIPGGLVQISAMSKDRALGVNRGHGIYLWSNNAWTKLPGAATWAGIGDGDERWVVNSAQQIFRWNHQSNNWNHMPGAAVNVDVQNPCRVIATSSSNQIFIWKNNNWQMINGAGTRSSINGTHYYTVNSASQVFIGN